MANVCRSFGGNAGGREKALVAVSVVT